MRLFERFRSLGDIDEVEARSFGPLGHIIQESYGSKSRGKPKKEKDGKAQVPRSTLYLVLSRYLAEVIKQSWYGQAKELAWMVQNLAPEGLGGYRSEPTHLLTAVRAALAQPPVAFGPGTEPSVACAQNVDRGTVRSMLVGVTMDPEGAQNDVDLIRRSLEARGVAANLKIVDRNATLQVLIEDLKTLVSATKCGDLVLVHWSVISFSEADFADHRFLPRGWATFIIGFGLSQLSAGDGNYFERQLLRGVDLSEFVTAVRNKGASVVLFIDTAGAAGLGIQQFQDLAEFGDRWRGESVRSTSSHRRHPLSNLTPVMRNAGDYAIFYAADEESQVMEYPLPDPSGSIRQFGLFSYSLGKALQTLDRPTADKLAAAIWKVFEAQRERLPQDPNGHLVGVPVLESSNRFMEVLSGASMLAGEELDLEIISPQRVHGSHKLELRGQFPNHGGPDSPARQCTWAQP